VTGSTSGIGLAIAPALAKEEGANVMNGMGDAAAIEAERAGRRRNSASPRFIRPPTMTKPDKSTP
jgi:3-hydroxybutyrate dehydrogenase